MTERRFTMRRILKDLETVRAVTPYYPLGCNRVLLSRDWYPTLARDTSTSSAPGSPRSPSPES